MRPFKIIVAIFFGLATLGNISMMIQGDFESGWNYFALIIIGGIFLLLIRSLKKEQEN